MKITVDNQLRVTARMRIESDVALEIAQHHFNDFRTFLENDPLHKRISFLDDSRSDDDAVNGTAIMIRHELFGVRIDRIGKVLRFKPGRELAVSDLSQRGITKGFPHVCRYLLADHMPNGHSLLYEVRGRWTARWVPRPIVRLWLAWVMIGTRARIMARLAHSPNVA